MTRYYIKRNGLPDYDNSLALPCTDKAAAIAECERLTQIQNEQNARADRMIVSGNRERGYAFLTMKNDDVFTVGTVEV